MGIDWLEGFVGATVGIGNQRYQSDRYDTVAVCPIENSAPGGGNWMVVSGPAVSKLLPAAATRRYGYLCRQHAAGVHLSVFGDAGEVSAAWGVDGMGEFFINSGTAALVSGVALPSPILNTPRYFEIEVTPGNPGALSLHVDNVSIGSWSGLNLTHPTNLVHTDHGFAIGGGHFRIAHLYVTSGLARWGPQRIFGLPLVADDNVQFTPSNGTGPNYTMVDDTPGTDVDATFNETDVAGSIDTFECAPANLPAAVVIRAVGVLIDARVGDLSAAREVRPLFEPVPGGTIYEGASLLATPEYKFADEYYDVNPATAVAFTPADLDVGIRVGYKLHT